MSRNGRGFEDEARQRVIDAARRSGLSVGDLVQALSEKPHRAPPSRDIDVPGERQLERRLDALSDRMRRLGGEPPARRPEPSVRRDRDATPDAALEEIAATVGRLAGGSVVRSPAAAPRSPRNDETGRILDMLEGLDRRVRSLGEDRADPRADLASPSLAAPVAPPPAVPTEAATPAPAPAPAPRARRASLIEEPRPPRRVAATETDALDRRFRELGEKIDTLRQSEDRDGSAALIAEIRTLRGLVETRSGADAGVAGEIKRLAGRIDRLAEQRPQREVIESVATELGRLRDVVMQTNVEGSLRSIEEGYGHIVDRLDDLKRGLADPHGGRIDEEITEIRSLLTAVPRVDHLSALERSLDTLADKFERLAARQETPASQQIERRLADLRKQIDALDPSRIVVSLDQRLQAVTDKLDALERSARSPAASDRVVEMLEELRAAADGNRTAEQMRALEDRIEDLGARITDFETRRPSFEDTDRLHESIAEIAGRLDDIAASETERASGAALEAAVARLDAAIAAAASPRAEELIDARFDELIDRLDRRMPNDPTAEVEALTREITEMRRDLAARRPSDDLEAQMRLLAERLDRSVDDEGDEEALGQIEEQLAQISRRLEESQDRFADLASIEDHLIRLADRMENGQIDAVAAAREAAREMVRELADVHRDDGASEAAMRALQDDLRALQSAARETETRNIDTLSSLHDALTGIVGRLAAIEKIAQGSARSAAAARNAAQAAETMAQAVTQQAVPQPAAAPVVEAPRAPEPAAPAQPTVAGRAVAGDAVTRARQMLAAATPEDNRPLEPGSGKPQARPAAPAVSATVAPPVGEVPATPAAARKADFIAAARRAAQAAVATAAPTVTPEDRPAQQAAAQAAPAAEGGALSRIGQVLKGRRRPLVLATAALVLAILTMQVIPGRKEQKIETSEGTAIESIAPATSVAKLPTVEPKSAERAPVSGAEMFSKVPTGGSSVGFSAPRAVGSTVSPQSTASIAPTTTTAPAPSSETAGSEATTPAQQTPVAEPATTGSVPPAATSEPAPRPSGEALPEAIGPAALRTAAAADEPKAAFEIGLRFAEGRTVPADLAKAATWYEKAASAGLPQAQYRLGIAYEKGLGVARDPDKARTWYAAAAEKGNVRAMHNLGVLFANARDMGQAIPWFQKAADFGLRDSQFNLGIIYALGSGVKQDLAVSYKWFALAARQGDQEAAKKQNDVASHLDKVNLAAARMAVQTWVQRRVDQTTNEEMRDWGDAPATAAAAPSPADLVRGAQQLLKAKGLYTGTVDGETGPATRAAIRAFQKKSGLAQTGEVDAALLRALAGRAL